MMGMKTEDLWTLYGQGLKRYLNSRIKDAAAADDLLQEVFIKAHLHLPELREASKVRQWLYGIARNESTAFFRNAKRSKGLQEAADVAETGHSEGLPVSCLDPLIERVPEPYRTALLEADVEGIPQMELAHKWGIGYSALKSRVQRGRAALRGLIEACCRVVHDKYGTVIDYEPRAACACAEGKSGAC